MESVTWRSWRAALKIAPLPCYTDFAYGLLMVSRYSALCVWTLREGSTLSSTTPRGSSGFCPSFPGSGHQLSVIDIKCEKSHVPREGTGCPTSFLGYLED